MEVGSDGLPEPVRCGYTSTKLAGLGVCLPDAVAKPLQKSRIM